MGPAPPLLSRCVLASVKGRLRVRDALLHTLTVERIDEVSFERVIVERPGDPASPLRVEPAQVRAIRFRSDGVIRLCDIVLLPGFMLAISVPPGRGGFREAPGLSPDQPVRLYTDDRLSRKLWAPVEVAAEVIP
ncbi:MAG: hypothetical protein ACKVZJ_06470 [Phycisphaerales bacterium]